MNYETIMLNPDVSPETKGLLAIVLASLFKEKMTWSDLLDTSGMTNDALKEAQSELKKHNIDIWKLAASRAQARPATTVLSFFLSKEEIITLREKENSCSISAWGRGENIQQYPMTMEDVILAASERAYAMSIVEAANFMATYAATDWIVKDGRKITNWRILLDRWKLSQNKFEQEAAAAEWAERKAGRDPYLLPRYEYYVDAQNIVWRRPANDETADFELAPGGMDNARI